MNIQFGDKLEPLSESLKLFGYVDFGCYNNGQQNTSQWKGFLLDYVQPNLLPFIGTIMLWNHDFRITYICNKRTNKRTNKLINEISDTVTNQTTQALATGSFRYRYSPVIWALDSGIGDPGSIPTRSIILLLLHLPIYAHSPARLFTLWIFRTQSRKWGRVFCHLASRHITPGIWQHQKVSYIGNILDAYEWDKTCNYLRIHQKLTNDHLRLNSTLKMHNQLTEQVLNSDMLYLSQN